MWKHRVVRKIFVSDTNESRSKAFSVRKNDVYIVFATVKTLTSKLIIQRPFLGMQRFFVSITTV